MASTYDGIIIGAGHNAMILQAYLGKAGMKVLAVERKAVTGGGLSTLEDPRHPGFLHNTHAFFQRAITTMPWFADQFIPTMKFPRTTAEQIMSSFMADRAEPLSAAS